MWPPGQCGISEDCQHRERIEGNWSYHSKSNGAYVKPFLGVKVDYFEKLEWGFDKEHQ